MVVSTLLPRDVEGCFGFGWSLFQQAPYDVSTSLRAALRLALRITHFKMKLDTIDAKVRRRALDLEKNVDNPYY